MTLDTIDWVIIASYLVLSLVIGLYYTKTASSSFENYFLGGRNMPWWLAGTSMVATTFAADTPLLVTELVIKNGISGNWLWWNGMIGGMLTVFFFARMWRKANLITDVELTEIRYSGSVAKFLRGFKAIYIGLLLNAVIIAWVNVALGALLKIFFNLSDEEVLFWVGAAMLLVVLYSSLSGLLGVAVTDLFQFVIAMVGCIVLAVLVLNSEEIGGIYALKSKLPAGALDFFPKIGEENLTGSLAISGLSFFSFVAVQWWASWYPGAEPGGGGYIAQRMMSARTETDAFKATLFFQIAHYAFRPWPWIIVALCAAVLYPEIPMEEKRLGYVMVMRDFLPSGLRGLLLVAFLAAYMSTISTQLNWGTSYVMNDFYKRFIRPEASNKDLVFASRIATFMAMVVGMVVTAYIGSLESAFKLMISCSAGVGAVLILRWYWWRINAWSELVATIAPFLAFWPLSKLELDDTAYFISLTLCTTAAWLIATFVTAPESEDVLKKFYQRVEPQGAWGRVRKSLNLAPAKSILGELAACWLLSTVLGYAILFGLGQLVMAEWLLATLFLGAGLVLWMLISWLLRRVLAKENKTSSS
ncbi:MAG: sodium:proline symporter [Cytophagales bacterium]|nr:MAG: sodium:proline symporter [Cytophagales bacterium]TAF60109.1 MAG: sodium:proline symporter [Cytophagales bacterium]